ncbi:MAG: non-heme iron oxygenase ferredoxin subunit [Actinomycetes bacterium]|jgi:3-phenylpropionate/trans-cinnamate dioxygenase ferredoxin subunit
MLEVSFTSLIPGRPTKVNIDGQDVCLARVGEEVFAVGDLCSHADVSLSEGEVDDHFIECWLHGSRFDLRTGEPESFPATTAIPVYVTSRDGDTVTISLPENRK